MPFMSIYRQFFDQTPLPIGPDGNFPAATQYAVGDSGQPAIQAATFHEIDGVRISVSKPVAVSDGASCGLFVTPFAFLPGETIKFRGRFRALTGPDAPCDVNAPNARKPIDSTWGALVEARTGGVPDDPKASRVFASLQHNLAVKWGDTPARLNSTKKDLQEWLTTDQYDAVFRDRRAFHLEMVMADTYSVSLVVEGVGPTRNSPPAMTYPMGIDRSKVTAAGLAIAIVAAEPPKGRQPVPSATVVALEFEILKLIPLYLVPGFLALRWLRRIPILRDLWPSRP